MAWSWRIGRIAGINIFVHWTFLLLLAFIAFLYFSQGASWVAAAIGIGFVVAVFGCVVLHELGHALVARRFGVPTRDITLLPIGGIARMQRMPEHPGQELLVAIAGPLVNVAIGGILAAILWQMGTLRTAMPTALTDIARGNFLANLMWVNFIIVAFNLLPAFPMDGGRVLRALLAFRLEYTRATAIAASAGQAMAVLFGLVGLLIFNPFLIFIALFVFLGASAESQQAQVRSLLSSVAVEEAMLSQFRTLRSDETLGHAADELLAGSQHDFPILEDGRYVGMLFRDQLLENLNSHGREYPVRECLSRECVTVDRRDALDDVIREMSERGCASVPVFSGEEFVGLLTLENVGEFMMIRSALKQSGDRRSAPAVASRRPAAGNLSAARVGE